jgi:hypothetical protein
MWKETFVTWYLFTQCSRVFLENVAGCLLDKKFPAFYVT